MQEYHDHLKQVTAIHHETIRRLVNNDNTPPLELAAMFEDVANLYLDISEKIREHHFEALQAAVPPSSKVNHEEEIAG